MWEKFKQRLGKIVQGVLNIFRKKKPQYEVAEGKWTIGGNPIEVKFSTLEAASDDSLLGKPVTLGSGEIFIDGVPFGKVEEIQCWEATDAPAQLTGDLKWEDDERTILECNLDALEKKLLEKLLSGYQPVLPKRIKVPTLIVSSFTNWDYDSIGVDISQLEEKGIAHYWCTTTKAMEECIAEFCERHPDSEWEEEEEEEEEGSSIIIKNATLLQWEDGHWEWVY